jgi:hypothetical protein
MIYEHMNEMVWKIALPGCLLALERMSRDILDALFSYCISNDGNNSPFGPDRGLPSLVAGQFGDGGAHRKL